MRILGQTEKKQHSFFHGGCLALRVVADTPVGVSVAARHFCEMIDLLADHARRELLPEAKKALDEAAAAGRAYRFVPPLVTVSLSESPARDPVCITLSLSVTVNGQTERSVRLVTYWDQTGTVQLCGCAARRGGKRKNPLKL